MTNQGIGLTNLASAGQLRASGFCDWLKGEFEKDAETAIQDQLQRRRKKNQLPVLPTKRQRTESDNFPAYPTLPEKLLKTWSDPHGLPDKRDDSAQVASDDEEEDDQLHDNSEQAAE